MNYIIESVEYYHDSDNEHVAITMSDAVDDNRRTATFVVQLAAGEYLPQMGCWITASAGEDYEFNEFEQEIFDQMDLVKIAEKAAYDERSENYTLVDARFNCCINAQTVVIEVDNVEGTARLLIVNNEHNSHDYSVAYKPREVFGSLAAAEAYLDRFRGDEHHDLGGLNRYLTTEIQN